MSFKPDISVDVCGKHFKNPVIAASGAYGFGEDYTIFIRCRHSAVFPARVRP